MDSINSSSMALLNSAVDFGNSLKGIEFPLSVLPKKLQQVVMDLYEYNAFPIEYTAASMVSLLGLAIGATYKVHLMKGWDDMAITNMALVGEPGTNKSNPLNFLIKPFQDADAEFLYQYNQELKVYNEQMANAKGEQKQQKGNAPMYKCYLVSDVTTEAVQNIIDFNRRGICLHSDELIRWINNLNRYRSGSDVQFWLQLFDGSRICCDRKTNNERVQIRDPYCSVIGTIQPGILADMMKGELSKNGFVERILFVYPRIQSKALPSMKELPKIVDDKWRDTIKTLLDLPFEKNAYGDAMPAVINFTDEAKGVLQDWFVKNKRISDNTSNSTVKGICSKLDKYIIRFCLILQLTRWACGEASKDAIDDTTTTSATLLVEYFREQAIRVHGSVRSKELDMKHLTVLESLPEEFETAMAYEEGKKTGLSDSTIKRFLHDSMFFKRLSHGKYQKIITV